MQLNKKMIQGIGTTLSLAIVVGSGLFLVKPFYDQSNDNQMSLQEQQLITTQKTAKLSTLQKGVDNIDETEKDVQKFLKAAPDNKDVESASRAISKALTDGVSINSFTFGKEENIKADPALAKIEPNLGEYTPPVKIEDSPGSGGAAASTEEGSADEKLELFHRIPLSISVKADSYEKLAKYVDSLSEQDRLIYVAGISSSGSSSSGNDFADTPSSEDSKGSIEVTIYAYSYIYGNK